MKSKIEKLFEMFDLFFSDRYDPYQFSCDLPDFCFKNYDELEQEHKGLGYYLDQVVPDICDEGEPNFDATHMKAELRMVYKKIKEMVQK